MKTGQVFVSHTSDMEQIPKGRSFVQAALDAVGRARMAPVDMRYFAARDGRPADYCRQQVRECEIYVAVVGFRYGSLVAGEAVSYTELEFLTASEAGLPRLIFLLEEAACPPGLGDSDRDAVTGFRRRLAEAGLIVRAFSSSDGLELEVFHALSELADDMPPRHGSSARATGVPGIWNVPSRNADFTGRAAVLRRLHEDLSADGRAVVVPRALYGMGGVGKTQTALEYAHRFKGDYDLVWWIPAEQPQAINLALANLSARLGLQAGDDAADAAGVALEHLRRDTAGRWLIIFDNAEDPAGLEPFLPAGSGHVIVTSRNHAWTRYAEPVELDVFSKDEGIAHLIRHVPGLAAEDAARIATAVGDLPLAIEQAAAWLSETGIPAALYIERLETEVSSALGLNNPSGYWMPLVATWNFSFNRLRERAPAAIWLLQILAFCSPEPISMTLLYGDEMIASLLPFDEALRDKLMLGQVIREITHLALVRVDQAKRTLQIHRLVQAVIRSQMTEKQYVEARHTVHRVLVGARPEPKAGEDPTDWSAYDIIWPHLMPSLAEKCDDERTRELLIDWVRYQRIRGELESGVVLSRRLELRWIDLLGADHRHTLRLQFEIANLLRMQGHVREARELDTRVMERQKAVLGGDHPHALATANSLAADLRALGDFRQALALDTATFDSFRAQFGEDFPRTLMAAHNLACSLIQAGDFAAARRLDEQTVHRYEHILGPTDALTLSSTGSLADDLRSTGALLESVRLLRHTYDICRATLGDDMPNTLRIANSLAISLRKSGALDEAMRVALDTHKRYLRRYGPTAPDVLSCTLNLAAAYSALGENGRAQELAAEVRAAYESSLGRDHPYTLAAANNLTIYLRCTGEFQQALKLAADTFEKNHSTLGHDHPSSLACAINLAACLGEAGDLPQAESLERNTAQNLSEQLGIQHPYTLACEAGLAVTLHRGGQNDEANHIRLRTLNIFTREFNSHPDINMLRDWQYLSCDLEPPRL
jgi:hypothetical protein